MVAEDDSLPKTGEERRLAYQFRTIRCIDKYVAGLEEERLELQHVARNTSLFGQIDRAFSCHVVHTELKDFVRGIFPARKPRLDI